VTPLSRSTLCGVWGTVLLPLDAHDRIEWDQLADEIGLLAGSDLDGVYAHGTAGEFHTLDETEFDRINGMLAAACEPVGKPFQIGASHPVPQVTLERIARSKALAPGAFQVILPDWVPPAERECEAFVRRLAAVADPVPLVLYNPPHAKTVLGPAELTRLLAEVPTLVGLKIADGDDAWYDAMRPVLDLAPVFVPGHRMATGLARGAKGSYSNVTAISPAGAARWLATVEADPAAAADLESRVADLFERHVEPLRRQGYGNPALDKFLVRIGDWCDVGLHVRWPYASIPPDVVAPTRRTARELVPELFEIGAR
jgi:dihydrodipicolinate synthase/N-acetylneuraminate lyase